MVDVLIFDTEANGLLHDATTMHCAVTKGSEGVTKYYPSDIRSFMDTLSNLPTDTILVCHNLIGYDLPLMERLYGYRHEGRVLDTLVFSRLLNPERSGRHSLGAWGERLGRGKVEHNDWEFFSEDMLFRCSEDVEINYLVYKYLMKEGGIDEEELAQLPSY